MSTTQEKKTNGNGNGLFSTNTFKMAVLSGFVILVGWKAVTDLRVDSLEKSVDRHVEEPSHRESEKNLTELKTEFRFVKDQLREIKRLVQDVKRSSITKEHKNAFNN